MGTDVRSWGKERGLISRTAALRNRLVDGSYMISIVYRDIWSIDQEVRGDGSGLMCVQVFQAWRVCVVMSSLSPLSPYSLSLSDDEEYDFEFVEELKDEYKCPVCLCAMKNPVQTKSCGHRYCRGCLLKTFRYYLTFSHRFSMILIVMKYYLILPQLCDRERYNYCSRDNCYSWYPLSHDEVLKQCHLVSQGAIKQKNIAFFRFRL